MNSNYVKGSHCSYCGSKFTEQVLWPRKCFSCYNDSFSNPLPVGVALIPVLKDGKIGSLIQQRGIEPKLGQWALTGGYMNAGETWQEATLREVFEEVGIETKIEDYKLVEVCNSSNNLSMLVFGQLMKVIQWNDIKFEPSFEVQAIDVAFDPVELAFPSHTEMLKRHLDSFNNRGW